MAKSRVLNANWYDYPRYYDIAFQACTRMEADFIESACRKYCAGKVRRLLEPGCGGGRLVTALAARGYEVIGFDISRSALNYLQRRITRRHLRGKTFEAEMAGFRLNRSVDAAYCLDNTFRHLLTEQAARSHLQCIADKLRSGGIYVLGMNLLPRNVDKWEIADRWTDSRGKTKVTVAQRVVHTDVRRRIEDVQVWLLVRHGSREFRLGDKFQLRTYRRKQFHRLLASVPSLEFCGAYDCRYDIKRPLRLNDESAYSVVILRKSS